MKAVSPDINILYVKGDKIRTIPILFGNIQLTAEMIDMNEKLREYEMMRQEILQYLEEYQTVRNMMYVISITILGFCLTRKNTNIYLFLLPLIVILPSYIISIDYWKCVVKAATYLIVFHEKESGYPFQWESRHRKLNKRYKIMSQNDYQRVPYAVCALTCILLYFFGIDYCARNYVEIIVGIIAFAVSVSIFIIYRTVDDKRFIREWKKVKKQAEKNSTP